MKNNIKFYVFASMFFLCLCLPKSEAAIEAAKELPFPKPDTLISMDFQDANLKDILKIFSIQSGLNFIASDAVKDRKFTLYFDNVPIREAMDKIFKANNLSYDLDTESNIFIVTDLGTPEAQTVTQVFYLKFATVSSSSLREALKSNLPSGGSAAGSSGKWKVEGEAGITEIVKKLLSKDGTVIEDFRTNSLIVRDMPSRMSTIAKVIAELDIPQPQVLLEVEMIDVSKDTTDKIGLKFGDSPLTLNTVLNGAIWGTKFPFGSPFGDRNYRYGATNSTFSPQYGSFTTGTSNYNIVLDFIKKQSTSRFLARPRLLTLNNETAEISITKDEIVGREDTTTIPTTGGQTTTSVFKRSTDLKLTPEGTGVYLKVTPQINPDTNEITMVINPKSSVTSQSPLSILTAPVNIQSDVELRSTKSIVTIKDGETVVIGGIIHNQSSGIDTKLPILGDIPFLGRFFTNKTHDKGLERELLVFITPHIVKYSTVQLAQAKKSVLPEREQGITSAAVRQRQEAIDESLKKFENRKK